MEKTYDPSIVIVAIDCRNLRRSRSGYWRLFAWWLFGFDSAGFYRGAARDVVGYEVGVAGTDQRSGRRDELSDYLVDYRSCPLRRSDQSDHSPANVGLSGF